VEKEELKRLQEKPRLKGPAKLSGRKVKYNFGKNKNNSIMKTALIIGSTGLIGSQLLISF
jgi:hypothetical protein